MVNFPCFAADESCPSISTDGISGMSSWFTALSLPQPVGASDGVVSEQIYGIEFKLPSFTSFANSLLLLTSTSESLLSRPHPDSLVSVFCRIKCVISCFQSYYDFLKPFGNRMAYNNIEFLSYILTHKSKNHITLYFLRY